MLKVDLGQLDRQHRLKIDEVVPADAPLWSETGITPAAPLAVHLDVQRAMTDVVVRGGLSGAVRVACRRCLEDLAVRFEDDVTLLFREGLDAVEAEAEELYVLPPDAHTLDLAPAIREQVLLAAPRFAICGETCRGLCPRCGANLNQGSCACVETEVDDRWAALRQVRFD